MPNIDYNRPNKARQYISITKHQSIAVNKYSKWINVAIERAVFDNADNGTLDQSQGIAWLDSTGNMWGFLQHFAVIGLNGEQFGFFDNPNNPALRWHGFPVIPFSNSRYSINSELLERWVAEGVFDQDDIPVLLAKRRIK